MKHKILLIIFILCLFIFGRLIYSYCVNKKTLAFKKEISVPIVTVENVKTENIIREFSTTARVNSKYRVDVLARISGYLVQSYFKEGEFVKAGQVLFEIEPDEYTYSLNRAVSSLKLAESKFRYAQKQLIRYGELLKNDYVSKSDYDSILTERDSLAYQVENCKNEVSDAKRNLSYTKIKSPVDGKVGAIFVTVGNYVNSNSGALTTINSNNPMYISFTLDKKDYEELLRIDKTPKMNRYVTFIFSSGKIYEHQGIQDFFDNRIDETTGTIALRATFPNPQNELLHGDFGKVIIYSKLKDAVPVIPATAIMQNQEGKFVYVVNNKNIPQIQYIKTAGQYKDNWIVSSGLKEGDTVIITGLQKVIPGSSVKIKSDFSNDTKGKK